MILTDIVRRRLDVALVRGGRALHVTMIARTSIRDVLVPTRFLDGPNIPTCSIRVASAHA